MLFIPTAALFIAVLILPLAPAVCSDAVRGPALLSFEELIALYELEPPPAPLSKKLEELLGTPFVENRGATHRVEAIRVEAPEIGPVLRVAHWNIERGLSFDDIGAALGGARRIRSTS